MNLWLSPEFFHWNNEPLSPTVSKGWDFLKPYDLLKHAKKRLDEVDDGENLDQESPVLGEVVYQLRRAIEHREKHLDKNFNLSELPFEEFPSKKNPRTEERLYKLDIIKPILRSKLNRLRNIITHEQKDPYGKDKSEIMELSEFTWYFLRSTDSFLAREISGMIFYPPDFSKQKRFNDDWRDESIEYDGCFLIKISPDDKWRVDVQGYSSPINLFSKSKKDGWLELVVNDVETFPGDIDTPDKITAHLQRFFERAFWDVEDVPEKIKDAEREKTFDKYSSSGMDIKHFEGALIGSSKALKYIIHKYFELYMYY